MTTEHGNAADREQRFQEALAACVEALQAGRSDRAALLARYPEFADELAEFFADCDRINHLVAPATELPTLASSEVTADAPLGTLPAGILPSLEPLFASPTHPRYNAFAWETWHELDVLRRELAPRLEAQKP